MSQLHVGLYHGASISMEISFLVLGKVVSQGQDWASQVLKPRSFNFDIVAFHHYLECPKEYNKFSWNEVEIMQFFDLQLMDDSSSKITISLGSNFTWVKNSSSIAKFQKLFPVLTIG